MTVWDEEVLREWKKWTVCPQCLLFAVIPAQSERTKRFHVQVEPLPTTTSVSHLAEVMVFFRLLEVKGFPLFFTRSCQQVVKHVVVSGETNVQVTQKLTTL